MGYILFYSNYCIQCQKLIQFISKTNVVKKIHFICIDNRKRNAEGNTLVILENGQNMVLPPNINRVPALVLVIQNNRVLFGYEEISRHFNETIGNLPARSSNVSFSSSTHTNIEQTAAIEPSPYVLNTSVGCGSSGFGVTSDQFSYYDTPADEYNLEKGRAGTRQMHNYVSIKTEQQRIWAPEETYKADKIGEISLEKIQQQRNNEIGFSSGPPPTQGAAAMQLSGFTPHIPPPPN